MKEKIIITEMQDRNNNNNEFNIIKTKVITSQ